RWLRAGAWHVRPAGKPGSPPFPCVLSSADLPTPPVLFLPSLRPAPLYREWGVAMKEALGRSWLLAGEQLLRGSPAGHVLGGADHRRGDRENTAQRDMRLPQLALHDHCAMQVQEVELLGVGVDFGLDRLGDQRGLALHAQDRLLGVEQGTVEGDGAVVEVQPPDGALDGNPVVAGDVEDQGVKDLQSGE